MVAALRNITLAIVFPACFASAGYAQHYLRGEIKDVGGVALQNAKIFFPSTKNIYYSGTTGGFGIPSAVQFDSLVITLAGFDSLCLRLNTDDYQHLVLKPFSGVRDTVYRKLSFFNTGQVKSASAITNYGGETYTNLVENDFVNTSAVDHSTFGLRIDKASYSNIRRFINQKTAVPPDAVRIEEILNYFNLNYTQPDASQKLGVKTVVTDCPWNPEHRLALFDVSAQKLNPDTLPPSNFVFLIDASGSMDLPNRLSLLKEAFPYLVNSLREKDTVSIVAYGGQAGVWLTPTSGAEKGKIIEAIERLNASGSTPGESALRTAYKVAESTFIEGGNNRVILATDGDFNVGAVKEEELRKFVLEQRNKGIYLTCLGVGMGNYKDSKLEVLAKNGNGNFAYLDELSEAEKILLNEFTETMYVVANDVYADIRFDTSVVSNYRLIGYDNERSEIKDFISKPMGGSIGPGFGTTVLFEITPAKSDSVLSGTRAGSLSFNYRTPWDSAFLKKSFDFNFDYRPFETLDKSHQFAVALAMFGLKLRKSAYFPDLPWITIRQIAEQATDGQDYLRQQLLELIDKYDKLFGKKKK